MNNLTPVINLIMRYVIKYVPLLLLVLLCARHEDIRAQGPPITLTAPGTLGFQGSAIRTFGMYSSTENSSGYTQVLAVPYNITTDFQIGLIGRYTFVNPNGSKSFNGFNNTTIFLKHQVFVLNEIGKTTRISGLVRQTIPTSNRRLGGEIYSTYIGVSIGDISLKRGFYTNLGYVLRSNETPDHLQYDFSFGIPFLPHVYPLNQFNGLLELNGISILGEDIHTLYLAPGLQYIKGNFLIESSIQFPLYQTLENENFRILLGTRILI